MGEKIVIGPFNKGLRNDRPAFMIDNDSFPTLFNAYQWRGRVKRKRGTSLLGRLTRLIETQSIGVTGASPWTFNMYTVAGITPEPNAMISPGTVQIFISPATFTGNLVASPITTPPNKAYTRASDCQVFTNTIVGLNTHDDVTIAGAIIQPRTGPNLVNGYWANIEVQPLTVPPSFKIHVDSRGWGIWLIGGTWTRSVGAIIFQDQGNGTLMSSTPLNSGIINYATGEITIIHTSGPGVAVDATFEYFPMLPVMGLEDFNYSSNQFPGTIGFDTTYSYNINPTDPNTIYDVNFYKNPVSGTYPGYIRKQDGGGNATPTPFVWNGETYQQVWTTNYQGAMWTTYGIKVPFNIENIGMQFAPALDITYVANTATTITVNILNAPPLVVGDFVFFNEWKIPGAPDPVPANNLNFQTGYVTAAADPLYTITLPYATLPVVGYIPGIIQYLTNVSDPDIDVLRWYDGDPRQNDGIFGWVNFQPPLSQFALSISDLPSAQYYLVGARIILPYKDRLLFFGPVVQTSIGDPIYLQDTVIYSQNGTPYYTASFTLPASGDINSSKTVFHEILVPVNQTATANAYFVQPTGFGGFIQAGIDEPILGATANEDLLIIGFATSQSRLIYTGNDITPFLFFQVNSELGTGSIFSTISMDQGVISRGSRGYIITNQTSCQRIDLEIPDQVFQISLVENGSERFTAIRDFINEWIYFTFPDNDSTYVFPNQTLQYNYRDNSWAIFNETYTHYGTFRRATGETWLAINKPWKEWNDPWDAGSSNTLQPEIIAGNQQGFIMVRANETTEEEESLAITAISGSSVTSPDHSLNEGDFIYITGALGTVGAQINDMIFQVSTPVTNSFILSPNIVGGTYTGGGLITRMYRPFIRTKQFPVSWELARKTRLGTQQYLLTKTDNAQITALIYLSQDETTPFNISPIVPDINSVNNGLVYSAIVYTCPESTNLGLSPANITASRSNLAMLSAVTSSTDAVNNQSYIWHRVNTSLLGDTIQVGFTLSDQQMMDRAEDGSFISQFEEIEVLGIILDVSPSGVLS